MPRADISCIMTPFRSQLYKKSQIIILKHPFEFLSVRGSGDGEHHNSRRGHYKLHVVGGGDMVPKERRGAILTELIF